MREVLDFIEYCHKELDHRPQCVLFSCMLKLQFPEGETLYDNNHAITKIGDKYYDWDGLVDDPGLYIPFNKYGENWIISHYKIWKNGQINF